MSLKSLTNAEMVKLGTDLLAKGDGKPRSALEEHPALKTLLPNLERAQAELVESQPGGNAEVAELTERLAALDLVHDNTCRGIDLRIASELSLTTDTAVGQKLESARGALFPNGMAIVGRSYTEEAGEVTLRAKRVTADHRKLLAKLKCLDGKSVDDQFTALQEVGAELGEVESRRSALGADGARVIKNGAARNQWIRAVNAISAVMSAHNIDESKALRGVREAEANADRRSEKATDGKEDTNPGAPPVDAV